DRDRRRRIDCPRADGRARAQRRRCLPGVLPPRRLASRSRSVLMPVSLVNDRTRALIATAVELAETRRERRRGLLGRESLDPSAAWGLTPCAAVHTAFMRFPIDVVFLDREGVAVKLVNDLPPWRIAAAARARSVVELPAGSLRRHSVAVGDRLYIRANG